MKCETYLIEGMHCAACSAAAISSGVGTGGAMEETSAGSDEAASEEASDETSEEASEETAEEASEEEISEETASEETSAGAGFSDSAAGAPQPDSKTRNATKTASFFISRTPLGMECRAPGKGERSCFYPNTNFHAVQWKIP